MLQKKGILLFRVKFVVRTDTCFSLAVNSKCEVHKHKAISQESRHSGNVLGTGQPLFFLCVHTVSSCASCLSHPLYLAVSWWLCCLCTTGTSRDIYLCILAHTCTFLQFVGRNLASLQIANKCRCGWIIFRSCGYIRTPLKMHFPDI